LEHFWRLKAIVFKFGFDITTLSWELNKFARTETIALLSYLLPNLESLTAISWKLQTVFHEEHMEILNFQKLKKLKILKCDKTAVDFFSTLLRENIISELDLQGDPGGFLHKQQSVKKLDLSVDCFNPDEELISMNLSHLRLKLRRYSFQDRSIIQRTLQRQTFLTSLDLINCQSCFENDDIAFVAVCNLKQLDELKINIDGLNSSAFIENFGKLNLKSLEMESLEHNSFQVITIIDDFSRCILSGLKHLKIYLTDVGIPIDRIERMGSNLKNLKSFNIRYDHLLPLDSYLTNFKQLESLYVDYHYTKDFSRLCTNFALKCDLLLNLSLNGFGFGSEDAHLNENTLIKITEMAKNLEKLELDTAVCFQTELIFKIMHNLNNLKVLKNWTMVQSGDIYNKFNQQSILDLRGIAKMLDEFTIELKLKTLDVDISLIKEELSKDYHVAISRIGNFFVIRITKK
jgi:hypothetical protein